MLHIINVGYSSTNYYVLASSSAKLLIDVGFPGTLPTLRHHLKRSGIALSEIGYLLASHYHPDHAGLAQELKQLGTKLLVLETQHAAIPLLRQYLKPNLPYQEITLSNTISLQTSKSRAFLQTLGIAGEIIATPGHSADSVTLILDSGAAFTGDLPRYGAADLAGETRRSWEAIAAHGVTTIYPGHGPVQQVAAGSAAG